MWVFFTIVDYAKMKYIIQQKKTHRNGSDEWFINVFLILSLPPLGSILVVFMKRTLNTATFA